MEDRFIKLRRTLSHYVWKSLQLKWHCDYLESIAKHFLGLAVVFAIMVVLLV